MALQGLLCALLALCGSDLMNALGAEACSAPGAGRNCYPWGMREGPMGDWRARYASEETYLRSIFSLCATLGLAVLAPFAAPGPRSGVAACLALALFALVAP